MLPLPFPPWVSSALLLSFPSKDIPGRVVCLSLSLWRSWHGDTLCFALCVVSYQHTSQWGGSSILRPGSCAASPQTAGGMFCMVTSKRLPLATVNVKSEQPQGVASVCAHSPRSPCLPPTRAPGSAQQRALARLVLCASFPRSSGVPGGSP